FAYGAYRLYEIYRVYDQAEKVYEDLAELVVQPNTTIPTIVGASEDVVLPTMEVTQLPMVEDAPEVPKPVCNIPVPITVDFKKLHEINKDIVGWLYCEGTSVNYPVLQGETNNTYLRHQYDGKYNYAGSIFMDYRCDPNLEDEYTMIFGHNMSADIMFHILDHYRKQDYLQKHPRFFYLTPFGNYCLEVICSNVTAYKDDLRLFELLDDTRNLELIRSKAKADSGVEVSESDRLVLLATCAKDYKNARCTLLCRVFPLTSE
ncbi:MAG: class B sortase, partial [Oscillospiraceae bacterium]|nr:class B sortase [Oscillospiraceae bacterium]